MSHDLTTRQAIFVKELSKGHNQTESAILAGYSPKNADVMGSRLVRNSKVVKALDRVGLTDLTIARGIKTNVDAGMGIKATADTSLRGLELASRLKGYLGKEDSATNLSQTNIYINELRQLSETQLRERLDKVLQEIQMLKG